MKTSLMTFSFSPSSMFQTSSMISVAESGLVPLAFTALVVASSSLSGSLVSPVLIWVRFFLSGHSLLQWPIFLQLKHLPSFMSLPFSSSVRAAWAQECPSEVSMALGSLANPCCHCCLEGRRGLLLFGVGVPKWAWSCINFRWCQIAPSTQSPNTWYRSMGSIVIIVLCNPIGSPLK